MGEFMPKIKSWEVSDSFWDVVESLIPSPERDPNKAYKRKSGGGRKPIPSRTIFEGIMFVLRTGCPVASLAKRALWQPQFNLYPFCTMAS
jgi:transposase